MTIPGGIGPTGHQALERLQQQTSEQANTGQSADAAGGQAKFEQALHQGQEAGAQAQSQNAGRDAQQDNQSNSADTQSNDGMRTEGTGATESTNRGDQILAGLQNDRAQYRSAVDAAEKTSKATHSMSPDELLRAQLTVARVTLNESLAGQVGSKVDSDVQTLLKD